jgi:hypothetical protein
MNEVATALQYSSLLGGTSGTTASALTVDTPEDVFLTGSTSDSDFPTTTGAFQTVNKATSPGTDAFVTRMTLTSEVTNYFGSLPQVRASAALLKQGQAVTLTLQVIGSGGPTPTGKLVLSPAPNSPAFSPVPLTLNSTGSATLTSTSFPVGLNSLLLTYSGDSTHFKSQFTAASLFRVVGSPTILTFPTTYQQTYGHPLAPVSVVVQDSSGYAFAGVTVNFSGANLTFSPSSAVTDTYGFVSTTPTASTVGGLVGTASLSGYSISTTFPQNVSPAPLTLAVSGNYRHYGAPNPTVTYRLTGLAYNDVVTVLLAPTATPTSPPGAYPITATLSGAKAGDYFISSPLPLLTVSPAVLTISAKNVAITYGQTPPPITGYTLTGFVLGQTASIVTGAPTLTSTVTSKSPVGFYPIGVGVGSLAAPNYTFSTVSSGMGSVAVYKAVLNLTANNLTMTQGSPVPPLTYTLSGFVNGDTAATSVTGAPVLTTAVTSATKPGRYYIVPSNGALAAHNYSFHPVYGVLTVLP